MEAIMDMILKAQSPALALSLIVNIVLFRERAWVTKKLFSTLEKVSETMAALTKSVDKL